MAAWAWLGRMQQIVQQDLQARSGLRLRARLIWIIVARLYANVVMTWGGLVILPSFYGLFAGGFATPLLLERGGVVTELMRVYRWIHHSGRRLLRVTVAMTFMAAAAPYQSFYRAVGCAAIPAAEPAGCRFGISYADFREPRVAPDDDLSGNVTAGFFLGCGVRVPLL